MIPIILLIIGIFVLVFLLSGCKPKPNPEPEPEPEPEPPDPHFWKWQKIEDTTQRWQDYLNYMGKVKTEYMVSLEMKLYKWVSDWDLFHKLDYWDLPDEVWKNKKADCDGLARLSGDMLGRFVKISDVWWLEYYGYYRQYYYDKEQDEWLYKVRRAGHAITVYQKNEKLLAFSNTSWWNTQNFQDFIEIGEQTFPEGIYWVICRHWETGKMQWQEKANSGEILKGTNMFNRNLIDKGDIKNLDKIKVKKVEKWQN